MLFLKMTRFTSSIRVVTLTSVLSFALLSCSKHEDHSVDQAKVEVLSSPAGSVLKVVNAWARPTVAEQMATGAYMKITSSKEGTIIGVSSPVAEVSEIHEMKMDGEVMRMRAVEGFPLKAGSTVDLAPGGYHIMLMGLNQAVKEGSPFEIKIQFAGADGTKTEIPVTVAPGKDPAGQEGAKGDSQSNHHKH